MLLRKAPDLTYADVTPKSVYLDRRKFLKAMGIASAAVVGPRVWDVASAANTVFAATKFDNVAKSQYSTNEKQNTFEDVTHYNNFYEFGTDKTDPAKNATKFR